MKTKLLIAITKSNWGGAQKYVFDIATNPEIKNRFDISILAGGDGELIKRLEEENIKVYNLKNIKRNINLFSDILSFLELYKIIKKISPDIIHLNSSKMAFTGSIISRMLGINRIIFTAHGWPFNENRSLMSRTFFKILCAIIIIMSHKTIAVSKNIRDTFKFSKHLLNKIQVIYNGIPLYSYKDLPKLSSGSGTKHVVSVGELNSNKNHISVIKVLKFIKNVHYHIIGEGELRKEIEKEIEKQGVQNKVTMHGHIKSAHNILPQFDIFLLPSHTDALPYVISEALQAGLPVIARSVGGVPELLENSKSSTLYKYDSELINILNTYDKRPEKFIDKRFTLKNMISETKNLYLTLLE